MLSTDHIPLYGFFLFMHAVMEELKNAGIDVSPERLQAIMNSQGDMFKKGDGGK